MIKLLVTALVICMSSFTLAFAAGTDAEDALTSYEQEAEASAMGVCDSMRSTLVRFSGTGYNMEMFIPATNSYVRFYVIVKEGGNEYFIKRIKNDGASEVQKLLPMDWSAELMPLSMSYFIYHFFPERNHDCAVAPLK